MWSKGSWEQESTRAHAESCSFLSASPPHPSTPPTILLHTVSSRMMSRFRPVFLTQRRRAFSCFIDGAASQRLAERGYVKVKGLRVLDDTTVARLRVRLPLLFRGEFDTGVYPDEMHWREGISREDAPREVGQMVCCNLARYRHIIFRAPSACGTHISQVKICCLM